MIAMYTDVLAERAGEGLEWLRLLQLEDVEQVKDIIKLYSEIDVPRDHVELFKNHLLQRADSWFVDVSDDENTPLGLIYLTEIIPTFTAKFNVIFWDKKFGQGRRRLCQKVIATAFKEFELTRLSALTPEANRPLGEVALPKIGFHHEGTMRKAWRAPGVDDCDMLTFGLLRNEVSEWQPQDHLMTSLAPAT